MAQQADISVVLALETSGRTGSVAAGIGDQILAEAAFSGPLTHSAELFPTAQAVLARINVEISDIDHIYIAAGPGSFTGLRIAVTMAKMMAFANDTKIVAADTMDVLALNATEYAKDKNVKINRLATVLDAKRKQFYIAVFENTDGEWLKVTADCLITASDFTRRFAHATAPIWLLGEGLVYYSDAFAADGVRFLDSDYWPARARGVYSVGRKKAKAHDFVDPATLAPFYLRRPEATENWENLHNPKK
jgi:tRNA threonylcarbamoyladenosine biosynthesis protein TsaB